MSLDRLLGSTASDSLAKVVHFTARRQILLADATANVDTPGYRMRDLSPTAFAGELRTAVENAKEADPLARRLPSGVFPAEFISAFEETPAQRDSVSGSDSIMLDGNDRSIETLMANMLLNATRHNQAVNLLRGQLRQLRAIITENPSAG